MLGDAQVVLVGGTESMTQAPFVVRDARFGTTLGKPPAMEDSLWSSLTDSFTNMPMGMTAEKLGEQYKLTQEEVDAYSLRSQQRTAEGQKNGAFDDELTPVEVKAKKETISFSKDEHNRPESTLAGFQKLPKAFKKDGLIHAGAASGICDGAAALVMTTASFAKKKGLTPIGRLSSWGIAGCDPTIMGIGPVPASKKALARVQATMAEMDLIEINEAFAPQVLACAKELQLDMDKLNVDGGALAIGHPLAASGARITTHLLYALRRHNKKVALGSACIGGGQGIAVIVEAM
jgi:acetyl-CoA acyltransferase 2